MSIVSNANRLIDEMKEASVRDLGMATQLLGTKYIEGVAWHTEQAFDKLVMFGYAKYEIVVLGKRAEAIAEKLKQTWHPVKHHLTVNLLHEMFSAFGGRVNQAAKSPATIVNDPNLQPLVQKFAQRVKGTNYVADIRKRLEGIEAEIDSRTKDTKGFRELISISTEKNARTVLANRPDITGALEFAKQSLYKMSPGEPLLAGIDLVVDSLRDMYQVLYSFPYSVLNIAPLILPHSLTSRYPIAETDFENLAIYRENSEQLRAFFGAVIGEIEALTGSVDPHVEALRDMNSIGML